MAVSTKGNKAKVRPDAASPSRPADLAKGSSRRSSSAQHDSRSDEVRLACRRGIVLAKANRNDEAIEAFDAALRLDPQDSNSLKWRSRLLFEQNRLEEALISFRSLITADSYDRDAYQYCLLILTDSGRFSEAKELIGTIPKPLREKALFLTWRTLLELNLGQKREAVDTFATLNPRSDRIESSKATAFWRAFEALKSGNRHEALASFKKLSLLKTTTNEKDSYWAFCARVGFEIASITDADNNIQSLASDRGHDQIDETINENVVFADVLFEDLFKWPEDGESLPVVKTPLSSTELLHAALDIEGVPPEQREALVAKIKIDIARAKRPNSIIASRLWTPRPPGRPSKTANYDEELFAFIREVYGDYLKAERRDEVRAFILDNDYKLYETIVSYENHSEAGSLPYDIAMPSRTEKIEARLQKAAREGFSRLSKSERVSVTAKLRRLEAKNEI